MLIKNPEDQQVQVPSSKSLGWAGGVLRKRENGLTKKTTGGVSKEYIHFDEGWVWIDDVIVLLNTKERHLVVGSKMLSKLRIFSIHGLWSGETIFF